MLVFGSASFVFLAIILLGAYKVWMGVTHVLSKLFHQTEEPHIKKAAGIVVAVTVLVMVAPLLIPTSNLYIREFIFALYLIYGATSVYQIYTWCSKHFGKKSGN